MPILNGRTHDWPSLNIVLPSTGDYPMSVQSVTYPSHTVEKTAVYGTGQKEIGFTRGEYSVEGLEIVFLSGEWNALKRKIGPGYLMGPRFPISFIYMGDELTPITDTFIGCQISSEQPQIAKGNDPLTTKVTFKPSEMILDGLPAVLSLKA